MIYLRELYEGMLVIVNDTDQPCLRLTAEVMTIKKDHAVVQYISKEFQDRAEMSVLSDENGLTSLTSLHDFGIKVIPHGYSQCIAIRERDSKAKYKNGKTRLWQPTTSGIEFVQLTDELTKFRRGILLQFFMREFSLERWEHIQDYALPFLTNNLWLESDIDDIVREADMIKTWMKK